MALDAGKAYISFQAKDKVSAQVDAINRKIEGIKDKQINLNVKTNQQVSKNVTTTSKNISQNIQQAASKRATGGGSFGADFNKLSKDIQKLANLKLKQGISVNPNFSSTATGLAAGFGSKIADKIIDPSKFISQGKQNDFSKLSTQLGSRLSSLARSGIQKLAYNSTSELTDVLKQNTTRIKYNKKGSIQGRKALDGMEKSIESSDSQYFINSTNKNKQKIKKYIKGQQDYIKNLRQKNKDIAAILKSGLSKNEINQFFNISGVREGNRTLQRIKQAKNIQKNKLQVDSPLGTKLDSLIQQGGALSAPAIGLAAGKVLGELSQFGGNVAQIMISTKSRSQKLVSIFQSIPIIGGISKQINDGATKMYNAISGTAELAQQMAKDNARLKNIAEIAQGIDKNAQDIEQQAKDAKELVGLTGRNRQGVKFNQQTAQIIRQNTKKLQAAFASQSQIDNQAKKIQDARAALFQAQSDDAKAAQDFANENQAVAKRLAQVQRQVALKAATGTFLKHGSLKGAVQTGLTNQLQQIDNELRQALKGATFNYQKQNLKDAAETARNQVKEKLTKQLRETTKAIISGVLDSLGQAIKSQDSLRNTRKKLINDLKTLNADRQAGAQQLNRQIDFQKQRNADHDKIAALQKVEERKQAIIKDFDDKIAAVKYDAVMSEKLGVDRATALAVLARQKASIEQQTQDKKKIIALQAIKRARDNKRIQQDFNSNIADLNDQKKEIQDRINKAKINTFSSFGGFGASVKNLNAQLGKPIEQSQLEQQIKTTKELEKLNKTMARAVEDGPIFN